jgi:DNA-binding response OmpR family regulator/signal transduction histidine kinase
MTMLLSGRNLVFGDQEAIEVSLMDISRQKQLERLIAQDHTRVMSLIDALTAGLFLVDGNDNISELNRTLGNILDVDLETLKGQPFKVLFTHLLSGALEPEVVQQSLNQAVVAIAEKPVVVIAGGAEETRYIEVSFFPVWGDTRNARGWGGLVRDVTEERDRQSWKLELLAMLAHDIRAPLATLKGHATALLANYRNWNDEMVTQFLEAVDRNTDRLVRQVERSLALTRIETGRLGIRPEAVIPHELISQAVERAAGILGDIEVEIKVNHNLPSVHADPVRVDEVLLNLLDNAVRYSPPNKPIVIQALKEGSQLQISVTDMGPGVVKDFQQEIFKKFVRGDLEEEGSGLGLYISRKIIEAHGGRIWVVSPAEGMDQGARFSFSIPLMPKESDAPSVYETDITHSPKKPGEGQRVLIVENEFDTQALLRTALISGGYQVEIAPDGPTAIDIVQTSPPELVLLDWMLPGMDGPSVCRHIRRWSNVPILMVTSKTAQEDLIAALDSGADDYLTKPFQTPELLARSRALLRRGDTWVDESSDQFSAEGLLINFDSRQLWLSGERINLTPTEFDLISYLAKNRGQVMTYELILEHLYGHGTEKNRHDLFVHISRLRKKIETNPQNPQFIQTSWGVGYIFMPR